VSSADRHLPHGHAITSFARSRLDIGRFRGTFTVLIRGEVPRGPGIAKGLPGVPAVVASDTAILYVTGPATGALWPRVRAAIRDLPGVADVSLDVRDALIAVRFDEARIGVAEIIRRVEDAHSVVTSVVQRHGPRLRLAQ